MSKGWVGIVDGASGSPGTKDGPGASGWVTVEWIEMDLSDDKPEPLPADSECPCGIMKSVCDYHK